MNTLKLAAVIALSASLSGCFSYQRWATSPERSWMKSAYDLQAYACEQDRKDNVNRGNCPGSIQTKGTCFEDALGGITCM